MTESTGPSPAEVLRKTAEAFLYVASHPDLPADAVLWNPSTAGLSGTILDDTIDDDDRRAIVALFAAALGTEATTESYAPYGQAYAGATALDVRTDNLGVPFHLWTLIDRVELVNEAAA